MSNHAGPIEHTGQTTGFSPRALLRRLSSPTSASSPISSLISSPISSLILALILALVVLTGTGCDGRPQPGGDNTSGAEASSTAMAPSNHLDPPALAVQPTPDAGGGVPVLCYHYFRGAFAPGYALKVLGSVLLGLPALGPREFWTTPAAEFERHLRHLRDRHYAVVTLDEVAAAVTAGRPLPERAVVLTIDDADRSVYEQAFPLLKKYGVRAHLFVPTAHIGRSWSGLQVCRAEQLREMAASGFVLIESHTHDLHFKVSAGGQTVPAFLAPQQLPAGRRSSPDGSPTGRWAPVANDLTTSRDEITSLIGRPPQWLAWPYGFATPALDSLSRAIGFSGTVSLAPRVFSARDRDLQVGRYTLTAHTTMARIASIAP